MMNIGPEAADDLGLWEYEALLFHWNESHGGEDAAAPNGPDRETAQRILDMANANPKLTGRPVAA